MAWPRFLRRGSGRTMEAQASIARLEAEVATLREALPVGYDPDQNLSATGGGSQYFRRLSASKRDLEPMTQRRAQEIAFYLYDTNPFAKRVVRLLTAFVVGEGVTVTAQAENDEDHAAEQSVIDRQWDDPVNLWDLKLPDRLTDCWVFGEAAWTAHVNAVDGHVRWGYIDPGDIHDVICDPENAELALALKVATSRSALDYRYYRVIHVDEDPASASYGRLVGAPAAQGIGSSLSEPPIVDPAQGSGEPIVFAGSCLFTRINKVSNAKRGRSDLLTIADWVDALDQYLFNEVDRAALLKNFIWDVQMEGADEAAQQAYLAKNGPPKPASVRVHNDKVKWEAVTPDLKTTDAAVGADLLLWPIATGAGLPKTWLAGTLDVNRATAETLGEPAFKEFTARQKLVRYLLTQVVTFALDQAELAGQLPRRPGLKPEPWQFAVQLPELRTTDTGQLATALNQTAQALVTALSEHLLDLDTAQEVMKMLVGQLGIDVDLGAMRARIDQARAEADARAALAPYPTGAGGAGQVDGSAGFGAQRRNGAVGVP